MTSKIQNSVNSMEVITSYLPIQTLQSYNLLNHHFYDKIVPEVMRNRRLFPCVQNEQNLFIHENGLWSLQLTNNTVLDYIDFENDLWRHDDQYIIKEGGNTKPVKLFDFKDIGEIDPSLKLADDEEILPQYIFHLNAYKYLIFPLKEALFIGRGLIIEKNPWEKTKITATPPPPEKLLRSGISLQKQHGRVTDVLFIGGNEDKNCFILNLEKKEWIKHGSLPKFHTVTEQINVVYNEKQTITIFVQVNFKDNCFEIKAAANKGLHDHSDWNWIHEENTDIQNFHIKNAVIHEDKLVIFARGKPRDVKEQCCSFLLIFKLKEENGLVTGFDKDYRYIKLNPVMYAEFLSRPIIARNGDDLQFRVVQENNYSDSFPRQVLDITIDNADFSKDKDLNNVDQVPAQMRMKCIDVSFK